MTARVLVVDDVIANVKLLEARLTAEYFEVLTAHNGPEALEICQQEALDVVLLDVMMPEMDGFEVCRRLKQDARTQHLPVVMVTALDQVSDKVTGLEAGADDFLTKPVDEIALITRVRNLARVKMLTDEMAMRAATGAEMGLGAEPGRMLSEQGAANILFVEDQLGSAGRTIKALEESHTVTVESDPQKASSLLTGQSFDVAMVSLNLSQTDGLRMCSQTRSLDRTRHLPLIVMIDPGEDARLLRALDMGVNDYLVRPIENHEMLARVHTQLKRKRYSDFLRTQLEERMEQAVTDPLTGLHNRRYMETHLQAKLADALDKSRPFAVMLVDIDYFKSINDTFGHDVGDKVLREFAVRLRRNTRGIDLAARVGGEEFVVIMPDTPVERAYQVAERLRACIDDDPFRISRTGDFIRVTASVGLAALEHLNDTAETILKRADQSLYCAKRMGRNRVSAVAA